MSTVETQSIKKEAGIEGELEFGQKNISRQKRNLLNVDEILRIPSNQLLVNLRGNKPLLLNKMIYKDHSLSKKLKDSSVTEYNPNWTKNAIEKPLITDKKETKNTTKQKFKIDWNTF